MKDMFYRMNVAGLERELDRFISENNISGKIKLWITGFSRAAAVGNITAADMVMSGRFDAVYASDLYRAMLTASAVYKPRGLRLHTDRDLREINVGPWETKFFGNVFHDEPESAELFLNDPEHWLHPGRRPMPR